MGKAQKSNDIKNKPQSSKFAGKPRRDGAPGAEVFKHKHNKAHVQKPNNKFNSNKSKAAAPNNKQNTQFKGKFKKEVGGFQRQQQQRGKKPNSFQKSKDQSEIKANKFQERQAIRSRKQAEKEEQYQKAKQEKEEQIRKYKKKRLEKTKALSKKTQRGQPLMKDRMQLLLKQIQEMKKNG